MFGGRRKKAEKAIMDGIAPVLSVVQQHYGIPPAFWSDPYVLGFLMTMATIFSALATGGRVSGPDRTIATFSAFEKLSHLPGRSIADTIMRYKLNGNVDFEKGIESGGKCMKYFFEIDDLVNDQDLAAAKERSGTFEEAGRVFGISGERSAIATALFHVLFLDEIEKRFEDH